MDILFPLHPFHRHRHHHRLKLKSPFNLFSSSYFHFQPFFLSLYQTNKTLRWWHVLSFSPSFLAWLDIFFFFGKLCTLYSCWSWSGLLSFFQERYLFNVFLCTAATSATYCLRDSPTKLSHLKTQTNVCVFF